MTALVALSAALFILLLLFGVFWMIKKRRKKSGNVSIFFYLSILSITLLIVKILSEVEADADNGPGNIPMQSKLLFTFADVVKMTNNFRRVLGKGGFGTVYHGYYNNLQVAVKLLSETSAQGFKEFRSEVT